MNRSAVSLFLAGILVGVFLATVGFALVLHSSNANGGTGGNVTLLKLGHSLDVNHPVHLAMVRMQELLAEKSGGTVRLEIFPNGQLGSETESLEQVQNGALAMTKTSTAPLESFIPEMAIFGVPYAFRDDEHYWSVLNGAIGHELLRSGESIGLHGLCYYDAGARSFYTVNKAVLTPDDLVGLKIRVQKSKTAIDMTKALGALPTPIAFGELYTALQQSMVDGAENNPPSFFTSRHFEVCKEYSLDEHTRVPDILLMSEQIWQSLSTQQQQWIQEAADESAIYERELWRESTEEALQQVEAKGVTVHRPDKQPFIDKVAQMHRSLKGTPVGNLLQRIREESPRDD